jgi:voltage-gated potassium channel
MPLKQARDQLNNKLRLISAREGDRTLLVRLLRATGLMLMVFLIGTLGYYWIADGKYDIITCAYMTIITLASNGHPDRMIFTSVLIALGMGIVLYFISTLTAFVVDGELRDLLQHRAMQRKIDALRAHIIIAGLGDTGLHVAREILASRQPCILIEQDHTQLTNAMRALGEDVPYIIGDSTRDEVLVAARLDHASGVVFALGNDRDNLFATISASRLNPRARIVTRGEDPSSEQKFLMAGATSVIYTNVLGGIRMASELLRPQVTSFLDLMMRDHGHLRRIEEIDLPTSSPLIGHALRETSFRQHTDALIVAIFDRATGEYTFNPGPGYVLTSQCKLIVLTLVDDIPLIQDILRGAR